MSTQPAQQRQPNQETCRIKPIDRYPSIAARQKYHDRPNRHRERQADRQSPRSRERPIAENAAEPGRNVTRREQNRNEKQTAERGPANVGNRVIRQIAMLISGRRTGAKTASR